MTFQPIDQAAQLQHAMLSRLKLRHFNLLQAISRHRSLGRVAAQLGLSQPAISNALHEVEDVFGHPLFTRTSRGMVATPLGEIVLEYVDRWLADIEAAAQVFSSVDAGRAGRLRLGFTYQVPQELLTAALMHLLTSAPRMNVMTREGTTDELVEALIKREIDCAIGRSYDGSAPGLSQEVVYEQNPCMVVAAGSVKRLARGPLDWKRLAALDWILPPTNTPMRRTYNAIFVGAGVQPPIPILETASIRSVETVLRREPNAICILARDVVTDMEQTGYFSALPYVLNWSLPPISFFSLHERASFSSIASLKKAVIAAARSMTQCTS